MKKESNKNISLYKRIVIILVMCMVAVMFSVGCNVQKNYNDTVNTSDIPEATTARALESSTPKPKHTLEIPAPTDELPYEIISEDYTLPIVGSSDAINVQYPQINGLEDSEKESAINNMIKSFVIESVVFDTSDETYYYGTVYELDVEYQVMTQTPELLSILFTGNSQFYPDTMDWQTKSNYRHASDIFAITINLADKRKLKLSDFAPIDMDFCERINQSRDIAYPVSKGEWFTFLDEDEVDRVFKGTDYNYNFVGYNIIEDEGESITFCIAPDAMYVSVPAPSSSYYLIKVLEEAGPYATPAG